MTNLADDAWSLPVIDLSDEGRTERRDAVLNRERILAAATGLFAERGVQDVTMAEIATAAGVGKGTLYRRFEDKGLLCLALMDLKMRAFQNRMLAEMREMHVNGIGYEERLGRFLVAQLNFTDEHVPLLMEVQKSGLTQGVREQPYLWQYLTVRGFLEAGIDAGQFRPDLDLEYVADALLAPLNARLFRFQRVRRGFSLERMGAGIRSLLRGLRRP